MNYVYVITSGSYSDYHIVGVWDDLETAKKVVESRSNDFTDFRVEVYQLKKEVPDEIVKVFISADGSKYLPLDDLYGEMTYIEQELLEYGFFKVGHNGWHREIHGSSWNKPLEGYAKNFADKFQYAFLVRKTDEDKMLKIARDELAERKAMEAEGHPHCKTCGSSKAHLSTVTTVGYEAVDVVICELCGEMNTLEE